MKARHIQFLILLLLPLTIGCFSSGSQIPFQDPGGTTGSEDPLQNSGSGNFVATTAGARAGIIFESVESENYIGVVMLAPSSLQGIISDQGLQMMEPMMAVQRDSVDFIFGGN